MWVRTVLVLWVLLAACGGGEAEAVPSGPVPDTDLEGAAAEFLEQRRVTSRETLDKALTAAQERLDTLYESLSARTETEQEAFEPRLDALGERIAALAERTAELEDLEQMEWERAHDALKRDVRSIEGHLRKLEAELR